MWKWFAAIVFLFAQLGAGPAFADASARAFDKVPLEHWAYEAMRQLEQHRHFTGAPEDTFSGTDQVTRYEFATAIERVYRSIQAQVLDASRPSTLSQDLDQIDRLLDEFEEDVALLGPDVAEMRRELEAMSQRVARLQSSFEPRRPAVSDIVPPAISLRTPRPVGVPDPFPDFARPLRDATAGGGLGVNFGDAQLALGALPADPFDTLRLPLTHPLEGMAFQARLSLPVGRHLFSALYEREGGLSDRYGLWAPHFTAGPVEQLTARVDTAINNRLGLTAQASSIRPLEPDFRQLFMLRTNVDYRVGNGLSIALGYELHRQVGPGLNMDVAAYSLGISRALGRRARIDVLYRVFDGPDGRADLGNSGAITQFSIRF